MKAGILTLREISERLEKGKRSVCLGEWDGDYALNLVNFRKLKKKSGVFW
jgi:hypothetical protein